MGIASILLSDVGEGVAEAELIEWHVAVGDVVAEDQVLCVVMTDKAAVEVPSSELGKVIWLGAEVGDVVAVGAELVRLEVSGEQMKTSSTESRNVTSGATKTPESTTKPATQPNRSVSVPAVPEQYPGANGYTNANRPLAAPSVRRRAKEAGIDLKTIQGSGPAGRITHSDIDNYSTAHAPRGSRAPNTKTENIKITGLRKTIAERMEVANSRIPHITIVEEVDIESLETLREELNETHAQKRVKLTLLPFVMKAIVEAVREQPDMNAHYDDAAGVLTRFGGVHIGIATQTDRGLLVPVIRHCESNNLWDNAKKVLQLAEQARQGDARREDLSGSTITITSLGPLGGIVTTPIINHPEVAIIGINKIAIRPHWDGQQFLPRRKVNISCSFDHRIIDGWDAAILVKKLKTLLETPALLFVED